MSRCVSRVFEAAHIVVLYELDMTMPAVLLRVVLLIVFIVLPQVKLRCVSDSRC